MKSLIYNLVLKICSSILGDASRSQKITSAIQCIYCIIFNLKPLRLFLLQLMVFIIRSSAVTICVLISTPIFQIFKLEDKNDVFRVKKYYF
jgi:hypothetical protein